MKFDINRLVGFFFLFILTVQVLQGLNDYSGYRFDILHLLWFILGITFVSGKGSIPIKLLSMMLMKNNDILNYKDEEE
tara:strand:- start:1760 stop:1993 length:234 start_codon:yes stop_codon:yes gene_type:complete